VLASRYFSGPRPAGAAVAVGMRARAAVMRAVNDTIIVHGMFRELLV
jgi:hypothetical protein